jgi:nucleoside-diphosphate-sugar epimerase
MRVAVIGANGFVARHVCLALADAGHEVAAVIRRREITHLPGAEIIRYMDDAGPETDWEPLIFGADAILHLVSPSEGTGEKASIAYRRIRDGTLALGRAAAATSVKRFVFGSTIKVNGEATTTEPFRPGTIPRPEATYGTIKLETENGLTAISRELGLPVTIARPGAVYGSGGVSNIHLLARLLAVVPGWLIPLGGVQNKRSLIHVGNLASALVRCVEDDSGNSRLFLLHDGKPVSTSELCQLILAGLNKPTTLLPDPFNTARFLVSTIAPGFARKLYGSLEIDDDSIHEALGWVPPHSIDEGLRQTLLKVRDHR